jgi:hypothetical protein
VRIISTINGLKKQALVLRMVSIQKEELKFHVRKGPIVVDVVGRIED